MANHQVHHETWADLRWLIGNCLAGGRGLLVELTLENVRVCRKRIAASLQPAEGQRPPATAWAMEVLKVERDGAQTTRLTARGAIAVTATHGAQGHQCRGRRR